MNPLSDEDVASREKKFFEYRPQLLKRFAPNLKTAASPELAREQLETNAARAFEAAERIASEYECHYFARRNRYSVGLSSFVEVWLVRAADMARGPVDHEVQGLYLCFNTHIPLYCSDGHYMFWYDEEPEGSEFPVFDWVDEFGTPALKELAEGTEGRLAELGYGRLRKTEMAAELPRGIFAPSILAGDVHLEYDALFYWQNFLYPASPVRWGLTLGAREAQGRPKSNPALPSAPPALP